MKSEKLNDRLFQSTARNGSSMLEGWTCPVQQRRHEDETDSSMMSHVEDVLSRDSESESAFDSVAFMFQNANGRWRFTKTPFLNKHKAKTPSRT
jgi:hypothetical protein